MFHQERRGPKIMMNLEGESDNLSEYSSSIFPGTPLITTLLNTSLKRASSLHYFSFTFCKQRGLLGRLKCPIQHLITDTQLLQFFVCNKNKNIYTYKLWMRRHPVHHNNNIIQNRKKEKRNKFSFKNPRSIKINNNISNQLLQSQKENKTGCYTTELLTTSTTFPNFQTKQNKRKRTHIN